MLALPLSSMAQWKPSAPIEIVVPRPAGGGVDVWARIASRMLADAGIPNYVSNRPGADTVIGTNYVAAAKPDGQTLLVLSLGALDLTIADPKNIPPVVQYTEKSFDDVIMMGHGSFVLITSPQGPPDYEEFKKFVRQNPSKFNVGTWNLELTPWILEWARLEKLPKPNVVGYRGSPQLASDIIGGHILFGIDSLASSTPRTDAGQTRILGIYDTKGYEFVKKTKPTWVMTDIQTRHQSLAFSYWNGILAPAGTPKEIINTINQILNKGLHDPRYRDDLANVRAEGSTPEEFAKIRADLLNSQREIAKKKHKE